MLQSGSYFYEIGVRQSNPAHSTSSEKDTLLDIVERNRRSTGEMKKGYKG